MDIRFEEATDAIRHLIDVTPRDGDWYEIDGYSISIKDGEAAIYEPGSAQSGECDIYVKLDNPIDVLVAKEKAATAEWLDKHLAHREAAMMLPSYDVAEEAFARWQVAYREMKAATDCVEVKA